MSLLDSIILGIVQGVTEFVPISSSGHLIIARELMGMNESGGLAFDTILHLATALALFVYFRKEIISLIKGAFNWILGKEIDEEDRILLIALILGTIPAVIIALFFESFFESLRDPMVVASTLIAGSLVFWIAEQVAEKNRDLTIKRGFITGIFQTFALIPGVSRSGITISGGLFLGLSREMAVRFSFLLGFPVILGSGLKKTYDLGINGIVSEFGLTIFIGSTVAFLVALVSIHLMLKYLKNHSLIVFVVYRIVLAVGIFFVIL